jgi:hypothetical protein
MKKITALEISQSPLPMDVRCLNPAGMFRNSIITFDSVGNNGCLMGFVKNNPTRLMLVVNLDKEFELLEE